VCGRFKSGHLDWQGYRALLESVSLPIIKDSQLNFEDREEIRPTDNAVIVRQAVGGVELAKARWWLIPFFYKGMLKEWRAATFNAKAETIKSASSYREAFRHRRCLVPTSGWWEWKEEGGARKQRYWVESRNGLPMMFGGVWDRAETRDHGVIESFSIVTQPPGALAHVHKRAPLVLWSADWARWIDCRENVEDLLLREPEDRFLVRAD
jgi:putative SOS response-associated peptidase YedK